LLELKAKLGGKLSARGKRNELGARLQVIV